MALIAIAADKGAPGVTTTALALAAVWTRPVLLAECDPSGGDLIYRFPSAAGGRLDPRRGMLSLAVVARRGLEQQQVLGHTQKMHGGLDVLAGVTNAEQGTGLNLLWGPLGKSLAAIPQADVIADCGRLGPDGPIYDLLAEATMIVLVSRANLGEVIRLRDRAAALASAMDKRGRRSFDSHVLVIADQKRSSVAVAEVNHAIGQGGVPAKLLGGLADDAKGAELLRGEWGGKLEKTALVRSAREVSKQIIGMLAPLPAAAGYPPNVQQPGQGSAEGQGYEQSHQQARAQPGQNWHNPRQAARQQPGDPRQAGAHQPATRTAIPQNPAATPQPMPRETPQQNAQQWPATGRHGGTPQIQARKTGQGSQELQVGDSPSGQRG